MNPVLSYPNLDRSARIVAVFLVFVVMGSRGSASADDVPKRSLRGTTSRVTHRRTLLDANGHLLRGTKLVIGKPLKSATEYALSPESWKEVRRLGLNTVRLCMADPWYAARGYGHWELGEFLPKMDRAIDLAEEAGVSVIVNYQDVGMFEEGRRDFEPLGEFWSAVAPRYADRSHVIYELVNEPAFDQSVYFDPTFKEPMMSIYRQVRSDAPERPVLMFSFNSIDHEMTRVVDAYRDEIDWDVTTVAFHLYGGASTASLRRLLDRYPAICTELNYHGTRPFVHVLDGKHHSVENCEDLGVSWTDWANWGDVSFDAIRDVILPDARAKGYAWPPGGGLPADRDPPPLVDLSGDVSLVNVATGAVVDVPSKAFAVVGCSGPAVGGASPPRWRLDRTVDGRYHVSAGGAGMRLRAGEKVGDEIKFVEANDGYRSQRWRLEPIWNTPLAGGGDGRTWEVFAVRLRSDWNGLSARFDPATSALVMDEASLEDESAWWRLSTAGSEAE